MGMTPCDRIGNELLVIDHEDAVVFPPVKGYNLNLQEATAQSLLEDSCSPNLHMGPKAKVVCFSTKDFGEFHVL